MTAFDCRALANCLAIFFVTIHNSHITHMEDYDESINEAEEDEGEVSLCDANSIQILIIRCRTEEERWMT